MQICELFLGPLAVSSVKCAHLEMSNQTATFERVTVIPHYRRTNCNKTRALRLKLLVITVGNLG